ncbi:MAG: hypothetical protein NTX85_01965 [Candidatus Nomurabacteria bacterium]|nr:hypothetical protein [Candidatus Nomurabacteria bacterium]
MKNLLKKKDKIIIQTSAIAVVDGLVSAIDSSLNGGAPLLGIAWGLSKGMYGANIQLRQDRAIEFVEMIRDNSDIFTKEILKTEEFQDGFVYTFQKYLSERVAEKRKIIKEVFCGFTKNEHKENFKLERILLTIEQVSIEDIEVVKTFSDGTIKQWIVKQFPEMEDTDIARTVLAIPGYHQSVARTVLATHGCYLAT